MFLYVTNPLHAISQATQRYPQLANEQVVVWKTVIFPSSHQALKMHHHDHDRVLVALNNGTLKITNDKGKVHYLKLEKDTSYFLSKDVPNELHRDENIGHEPIRVIVVELKN